MHFHDRADGRNALRFNINNSDRPLVFIVTKSDASSADPLRYHRHRLFSQRSTRRDLQRSFSVEQQRSRNVFHQRGSDPKTAHQMWLW